MIECRICVADVIHLNEPWMFEKWAAGVLKRLQDAGIPAVADGTVSSGTLHRLDDPTDFGYTTYRWYPSDTGAKHE